MPIFATVFSTPDVPSLTVLLSDSLANELVDAAPEVSADPEVPEDPDDEFEDVKRSSVGALHWKAFPTSDDRPYS